MPNLNYAEAWSPELLEILIQGTLTSPFVTDNVRWVGVKTFHFTQMSTTGFKNHSRKGGWNTGEYTQKEVADMMGISQSYISRLEKRIIVRLKKEILKMS